jgi:hypothetical protein
VFAVITIFVLAAFGVQSMFSGVNGLSKDMKVTKAAIIATGEKQAWNLAGLKYCSQQIKMKSMKFRALYKSLYSIKYHNYQTIMLTGMNIQILQ